MDILEIIIFTICTLLLGNLLYWAINDVADNYTFFKKGYRRARKRLEEETEYSVYYPDFYQTYLKGYEFGMLINKYFKK